MRKHVNPSTGTGIIPCRALLHAAQVGFVCSLHGVRVDIEAADRV